MGSQYEPDQIAMPEAHETQMRTGRVHAQFQDLTRRLVLYVAWLLRGASLDHHAYDIATGAAGEGLRAKAGH